MTEYKSLDISITLQEKIGAGAFGEVFEAKERGGKARTFAVKYVKCSEDAEVQNALDEIQALMTLDHENIVKIFDFGLRQYWEQEVEYTLVLEYCSNGNLSSHLGEMNSRSQKLCWIQSITSAVVYLHDMGIVHQDIKPDNILLDENGVIKVADFGLARRFARRNEGQSWQSYYLTEGVGAFAYVAPEMLGDKHTYKVDVFSLGILFHSIFEGQFKMYGQAKCYGVFLDIDNEKNEEKSERIAIGMEMYRKQSDIKVPFPGRRRRLIERMLKFDPNQRPTAKQVEDIVRSKWRRWFQLC